MRIYGLPVFFLLCWTPWYITAQGNSVLVSLETIKPRADDSTKLNLLLDLGDRAAVREHPDTLAMVYHEIAKVYWALGKDSLALQTDKYARYLRMAYRESDPESYCKSAYNLALGFNYFGERDSAIHYFDEVIRISPVNRQRARSAHEIGNLYKVNGEFSLAIQYGLQSLHFAELDSLHGEIQNAYTMILDTYTMMLHQGDSRAADAILQFVPIARRYYAALASQDGYTLKNYALVFWYESHAYKFREEYTKAEKLISEAHELFRQSGIDDKIFASELLNSRGILLRRMGMYEEAYDVLQQALEIRAGQSDSINMAVTHNNLGDVFFDQYDYPKALKHYHASVRLITGQGYGHGVTELPVVSQIERNPRVLDAFRYIGFKADAWRQYCKDSGEESYCREALRTYALADSLVDILRGGHLREGSKLFWREDAKRLYTGAIDAALQMHDASLGLYYSDRSKAVLVLDAVREHMVRNTPARALMEKKDSLEKVITALEISPRTDDQVIRLTATLDQTQASLRKIIPHYSESSDAFSLERLQALQQRLADDEVVIQYFDVHASYNVSDTPDTLYAFIITRGGVKAFGLKKKEIMIALHDYQESNTAFLKQGLIDSTRSGPDRLYQLLIRPLEPLPDKITIVPDGAIAQIGFDGLRDEEGRFLIETKSIRYDLSLAMGYEMTRMPSHSNTRVLAFAPMTKSICGLGELPFTRKEIDGISSIVQTKRFSGHDASKRKLVTLAAGYGALHLATHAGADTKEPGKSWVALAGDSSVCDLLYVQDLYTEYLPADMVVISACEGARGLYASGEGAMSVARGFAYAGAASIVTSLWQVNDLATAEIMTSFYFYLAQGDSKADALRKAKLDFLHDDRRKKYELHPAWWSAFIVIGNDNPLELEKSGQISYWYFILPGLVALAVILFYRRKRG